ncbi:MAG: hypothetical protein CMJ31_06700 [Phycisphaerae bacterium]|nr:hypothetical protein [Phycisphaerae bacterium]
MTLDPKQLAPTFGGKRLMVCVGGGIAAYKTATIVSRLAQAGAEVTVLMSEAATRFVTPLTFQALSARPVYTSMWTHIESNDPQHIALADHADAVVVAPCTMDLMARLAHGMANDVITLALSAIDRTKTPVLLAPAMNDGMWRQPATQRNAQTLTEDGFELVGPGEGWQACRHIGAGRMSEPEAIVDALARAMSAATPT